MRKILLAALVAGTAATPAFAQENSPFTGFRVEAVGGYDTLRSGERDDGTETSEDEGDESIDGVTYGVGAGFDFDLGGVVAGVEAEYSDSTGDQDSDETIDGINFTSRIGTGRDIYVGGRLGFLVSPTTMIYGKAGYTNTNLDVEVAGDGEEFQFGGNIDGWRLGAGIEQTFGTNAYGKIEYRYSNYNNLDISDDFDFDDFDEDDLDTDIDLDRHQVVAAIGLRF